MLPPRRVSGGRLTPVVHPQWYGPSRSRIPPPEIPVSIGRSPSWWQVQRPRILSPRRRLGFDASRFSLIDADGGSLVGSSGERYPLAFLVLLTVIFVLLGTIVGFLVTFTRGRRPNHVQDGETAMEHKTEPVLWLGDDYGDTNRRTRKRVRRPGEDVELDLGVEPHGLLGAHSAHANTTTLQVTRAHVETSVSRFAHGDEQAREGSGSASGGEAALGKKRSSASLRSLRRPGAEDQGTNLPSPSLGADVKIETSVREQVTSRNEGTVAAD